MSIFATQIVVRLKFTRLVLILTLLTFSGGLKAQAIRSYVIEVSCKARSYNSSQSILDFSWPYRAPAASAQTVYRKLKGVYTWGSAYRSIGATDSTFSDTVNTGAAFEYMFEKENGPFSFNYPVYGFVYAAHKLPATINRGKILLLLDSTHEAFLGAALRTYRNDLTGDGWTTELKRFSPATTVAQIKSHIVARYNADPVNTKSVVLIGNLAVPYSGDYSLYGILPPDQHVEYYDSFYNYYYGPSHEGAWPSDLYYGSMSVPIWPDSNVTNTIGARSKNRNIPNDGKFDYTTLPDLLQLQVGRIDLSEMTLFKQDVPDSNQIERELLLRYFAKNHAFKHRNVVLKERCLVDDRLGVLSYEHFGSNPYGNMAALISDTVVKRLAYRSTLNSNDYLWSFGYSSGEYLRSVNIASTAQLAATSQTVKSVFSGFLGSFFGDWDTANSFLRAPLAAKGNALNTFWCGRPHWYFHHMAMGEPIGLSALSTQNNYDTSTTWYLYPTAQLNTFQIHSSLMGDPTVRMQPVEPASRLFVWQDSCFQRVRLKWNASADTAVHNYYVFRAKHIDSAFTLLGSTGNLVWTDSTPYNTETVYMLRAEKLQLSGSGSYYNLSQGIFDTLRFISLSANRDTSVCTNQRVRLGTVNNNHSNIVYSWIPAANTRDTFSLTVTNSGTRILIATDTAGNCSLRDTFNITALSLPALDTIYASGNYCNDTIGWSSSQINGGSFEYNWLFPGGSPNDSSGLGLYNPGTVVYGLAGNYQTTLGVRNVSTGCIQTDTFDLLVTCGSLPVDDINLNCINSIKGKEIRFLVYDNERYIAYHIEGFDGSHWTSISRMPASSDRYYVLALPESRQFSEIRIMGLPVNGEAIVLGTCAWTEEFNAWTLMPNPFQDECRISYNGINGLQESEVKIYNAQGLQVQGHHFKFNDNHLELSLKGLKAGIYTFVIITGDKVYTIKAVKL